MSNRAIWQQLVANGGIHAQPGAILDQECLPKRSSFDFGRVEGMLLGLAIGDALGAPTESRQPAAREAEWGQIRDYVPNRHTGLALGYPSDDTQLSYWALGQLILDGHLDPENLAASLAQGRIFGIGASVRRFLANRQAGLPWHQAGPHSAGNGALMRIAPVLLPYLAHGGADLFVDAALCTMITHNDAAAISCSVAWVAMLWELLDMARPPSADWWLDRYVRAARDLEGEAMYTPRCSAFAGYRGPLWRFTAERIAWATQTGLDTLVACNTWHSGAYLLETMPSVLYILMRYADDPEEAIVRAVNDTRDNDTIASIVGTAVGALHGVSALPKRWMAGLTGRTTLDDDGRVFDLIAQARARFWR